MTTTHSRCKGRRLDGLPCQALAGDSSPYCAWHDPDREKKAKQRVGGGSESFGEKATQRPICIGVRPDGSPCRLTASASSAYCAWHDPEQRTRRVAHLKQQQVTRRAAAAAQRNREAGWPESFFVH